jgi:hypothetical protein
MSVAQHPLRRLGLVLGAALLGLALLSTVASSASAKEQRAFFLAGEESEEAASKPRFEGELFPTYLATEKSTEFKFGIKQGTLSCLGDFTGQLGSAAPEVTLASFYYIFACSTPGGRSLTISANGCENTLTVLNQGPPYVGQWGYKCPPGSYYEFHEGSGSTKCSLAIPSQTGLTKVNLANTGEGKKRAVNVTLNVTNLKYTVKGPLLFCQSGEYENGTITGSMTVLGFDKQF